MNIQEKNIKESINRIGKSTVWLQRSVNTYSIYTVYYTVYTLYNIQYIHCILFSIYTVYYTVFTLYII